MPDISEFEEVEKEDGEVITQAHQYAEAIKESVGHMQVTEPDEGVEAARKMGEKKAEAMSRNLDRFTTK